MGSERKFFFISNGKCKIVFSNGKLYAEMIFAFIFHGAERERAINFTKVKDERRMFAVTIEKVGATLNYDSLETCC